MIPQELLNQVSQLQELSMTQQVVLRLRAGHAIDTGFGSTEVVGPVFKVEFARVQSEGSGTETEEQLKFTVSFGRAVDYLEHVDEIILNADIVLNVDGSYQSHSGGVTLKIENVNDTNAEQTFNEVTCIQQEGEP